jgi:GPH family glycoside/pentoside/hexuronide:cation symporter
MSVTPEPTTTAVGGKAYTAPPKQIWGWAIGRVAEFGLVSTFGQAMNIFAVGFGLNPVVLGWCMMLPRVVDGVVDPIMGHWSDDLRSPWGRRKPFLVGGAFIGAFFLVALWWAQPHWSPLTQFVYLSVIGTCLYLCYGAYVMAWTAIGYELSDDYHERSKVAAIGGFILAAMGLANSWIYWFALRPMFGGVIWGMRWVGAGLAVLIIISAVVTALMTRERFTHANTAKTHVPIWPALKTTLTIRPFLVLLLMKICEIFGGRLTGGISFYLGVYYVCRGDQDLATRLGGLGATLGTIWNFAVLPFVKPASKLIGKRGALILGSGIGFATSILAPFITTPEHPYWGLIPGLIVAPLLVISGTIAGAILPDICDVDELQSGQRREGLFTSVMAFVSKLEISLAIVLVGYIVSWSSVDTKIGHRWEAAIDSKEEAVAGFSPGEIAAFGFKDRQAATFDTFSVLLPKSEGGNVKEFEIFASDESPTTGFRSLGKFQTESGKPVGYQEFKFAPVTAKYFKVQLISAHGGGTSINLPEIRLSDSRAVAPAAPLHPDAPPTAMASNLLAAGQGAKMLAAQPPEHVAHKLFWLVMIPGIIFSGLTFLMTLLFPLTEAMMKEVRRKLDEIRLAKAAAGEPTDEVAEEFVHEHPRQTAAFVQEHPGVVEEVKSDEEPPS